MNQNEAQKSFPENLAHAATGYRFRQINLGLSPSKVFRLEAKNKKSLYLKIAPRLPGFSLFQEKLKLEWLENRLSVPHVLLFAETETEDYLLLSEIPGRPASDHTFKNDVRPIIEQLAHGLKTIHSLPIEDCPFESNADFAIDLARERMLKNLVDTIDFDEERKGKTAEELFSELARIMPRDEDLVFTHGDYCVPNIILRDGKLSGFVDWGNAGVADRYQDIALLTRSIRHNFGTRWTETLFEMLGIQPDAQKIEFYLLLDEFF